MKLMYCLVSLLFLSMVLAPEVAAERPSSPAQTEAAQSSRAIFSDVEENYPIIRITADSITITHHQSGSGKVRGTSLRGKETYIFKENGTYKVKPGKYKHIVFGQVPSKGEIVSVVQFR